MRFLTNMKQLYKFLMAGMKSSKGNHTWVTGEWYKIEGELQICTQTHANGFHGSENPLDALNYVSGEIVAVVEVRGNSIKSDDKECWSEMRVVKAYEWTKEDSVALAIFSAELVIDKFEVKFSTDKHPRMAIESAKSWLVNPIEINRLAAVRASNAATRAADDATRAAAYAAGAAARAAVYAAAYAADTAADAADAAAAAGGAADAAGGAAAYAADAAYAAARAAYASDEAIYASDAAAGAAGAAAADGDATTAYASTKQKINDWMIERIKSLKEIY